MKVTLITSLAVSLLAVSFPTQADELDLAIDAALQAPTSEFVSDAPAATLTLSGHPFSLQPVRMIGKVGRKHTLTGSITHNAKQKTDAIEYRIVKEKGAIKHVQLSIDSGEWVSMSPTMMKALGKLLDTGEVDGDERKKIETHLKASTDKSWKSSAELLIALIAMRHC